jgi:hypothetical protein
VSGEIGFHAEPRRKKANVQRRQVLDLGDVRERVARLEEGMGYVRERVDRVDSKMDTVVREVQGLKTSQQVAKAAGEASGKKWATIGGAISAFLIGVAKAAGAL